MPLSGMVSSDGDEPSTVERKDLKPLLILNPLVSCLQKGKGTMTKAQALKIFKSEYSTAYWRSAFTLDRVALREAWGIYIDRLCKDRRITIEQYNNWSNPF